MEYNVQKLADMGRFEDDQLAHVATGEMIVPPVISPNTRMMIEQDMLNQGMDPNQYIVGGNPSINPRTGLQEFFIKKLFKKIKKVVKKVAPVAGALFIPGVGGVLGRGLGAVGSKLGIKAGLGSKFLGGKGLLDTAAAVRGGLTGLTRFGSGQQEIMMPEENFTMVSGGQQDYQTNPLVADLFQKGVITYQEGFDGMPGFFTNEAGDKFFTPQQVEAAYASKPTGLGRFFRRDPKDEGKTPQIIKSIGDIFGFGGGSGPTETGRFFGMKTPEAIKGIEDKIRDFSGDNAGLALLAGLYGKATKEAAEKTAGGLRDIRLSVRPDLMPQQTFQGFDVGVRPGMSYGGALGYRPSMSYGGPMDEDELDLRIGGPSIGPGTETSDDIPAMLSDGEFVMTAAANKGLGGFKIEKNKDSLTIFPTGKPDREQGFKNNDKLMKFFEDYQDMMS